MSYLEGFDFNIRRSERSGSVVAARLTENPGVNVLLLEPGESDETETVLDIDQWPINLGGELDWSYFAEPIPHLNGRSILYSMGRVLGGRSSINVGTWSSGHEADWALYAAGANDPERTCDAVHNFDRNNVENCTVAPGNLRIADASILPRVTSGNTMAPCVIVNERAAHLLQKQHGSKR